MSVFDMLHRPLEDIRISLTDRCNFRCTYCMPRSVYGHDYKFLPRNELLSFEELEFLVSQLLPFGLKKVRLTGGEPFLRKDAHHLVGLLRALSKDLDIAITTNGVLLKQALPRFVEHGLSRVTVSLDALDNDVFQTMADSDLFSPSDVLEGIQLCKSLDVPVKVNTVVRKGVNEHQIVPLLKTMKSMNVEIRFIEFMDVGQTNQWNIDEVVTGKEIRDIISSEYGLLQSIEHHTSAVARRWKLADGYTFGCIESVSNPFCSTCGRIRVSANGRLYTCLFSEQFHDIKEVIRHHPEEVQDFFSNIWLKRKDRYSEKRTNDTDALKKPEMSFIGG
ncbi:MAG: GTP 3',8-cyclase MoaA [Candidatus Poseidoniales archaeon]